MRTVSLQTYSREYVKTHSMCKNTDVDQLFLETQNGNSVLYYPLFMYCYSNGKSRMLKKYFADLCAEVPEDYLSFFETDERFSKFYSSFKSVNLRKDDTEFKNNVRKMLHSTSYSKYKMAKTCGAQPANMLAFIKGDNTKLSREKCSKLVQELL